MTSTTLSRSPGVLLTILLVGTFMTSLDVTIVNVAAPAIQRDLDLSGAALQLVVNGYSVALAALIIVAARLGDDRGHRRLFLAGLAGFTGASLLCGVAASPEMLVAARIAQGAAAAAMAPQILTLIQLQFQGPARIRALALQASVIAGGAVAGQIVGGALVDLDVAGTGWRPIFLVNIPIGIALLAAGPRALPATKGPQRRLDLVGALLMTDAVALVMVPLCFGHESGWAWWTWACLAAAVPVTAALLVHLHRLTTTGADPLIDLTLLRRRAVGVGLGSIALQMVAYGGFLFTLTLHLQQGLGETPLRSGLTFAPYAVGFAITSLACAQLPEALARRVGPAGLLTAAAGYVVLGLAARDGAWDEALTLPLLALTGLGFGAGWSPVIGRMMTRVPLERAKDASGLLSTTIQLAFAVGVATIGSWFLGAVDAPGPQETGAALAIAAVASGVLAADAALAAVAQARTPRTATAPSTAPAPAAAR